MRSRSSREPLHVDRLNQKPPNWAFAAQVQVEASKLRRVQEQLYIDPLIPVMTRFYAVAASTLFAE